MSRDPGKTGRLQAFQVRLSSLTLRGHVPQEEVDRRSALQGEPRTLEDDRGALEGRRIRTRNQENSVR